MKNSRWNLRIDQDGHLYLLAVLPLFLPLLLPYISLKEYHDIATTASGTISCWMFIWIFRRPKSRTQLPKKLLNLWIWLNAIASVVVIGLAIGTIFFGG